MTKRKRKKSDCYSTWVEEVQLANNAPKGTRKSGRENSKARAAKTYAIYASVQLTIE